ncbi:MAG: site-specific integrase [Prevotella sp.]|nr:site-specific integrase [Prevotella sp.]
MDTDYLIRHIRYGSANFTDYALGLAVELEASGRLRTARAYRSSIKRLSVFTGRRDIAFTAVTRDLIESFERRLREEGMSPNTISFYMRNLRAIYYKSREEGLCEEGVRNPFKHVFTGFHKTRKRALDTTRMRELHHLDYNLWLEQGLGACGTRQSALYTAWRQFIFCFHARGMCFVDMAYLRKESIADGLIRYYRKKTGGLIEVKVTPVMQKLIDSFSEETRDSPYVFPVIRQSDKSPRLQYESALSLQNKRLKRLARCSGIGVPLTTHVARHSWASIAKSGNTPLWVISEGLGHSSEKVTYTYLSQLERSRLDIANETVCALVCQKLEGLSSGSITATAVRF